MMLQQFKPNKMVSDLAETQAGRSFVAIGASEAPDVDILEETNL